MSNDIEPKEAAFHFEAVKTSMSQSKAGTILRLAIHPNEVPANLHTDWVGSRYMVAMVKLNEQDEPEISVEQREVDKLIASAGMLCRNPSFVEFLHAKRGPSSVPEPLRGVTREAILSSFWSLWDQFWRYCGALFLRSSLSVGVSL